MNDLIISVAKERLLPLTSELIDYPSSQFENQLHRIAVYFTKSILDSFVLVTHWSLCNASKQNCHTITEESRMSLALKSMFPIEWLKVAQTSPTYYIKMHKVIERYRFTLLEPTIHRIHQVVEFLCFELIETAVLTSGLKPMYQLGSLDLQVAVNRDPVLKEIFARHHIYGLGARTPSATKITFDFTGNCSPAISIKAFRLLRVYIEELIRDVYDHRENSNELTVRDVQSYFKEFFPSD
jgi:hypothetical protein